MTIKRPLIAARFKSALATYDIAATPQCHLVEQLVALLQAEGVVITGKVLEVGCGTGLLTQKLSELYPSATIIANDLVPEAEQWVRKKVSGSTPLTFVAGDAEHTEWQSGYRLIASSSCIQWWQQPTRFITKAHKALAHGGYLLLSTFLPKNLHQLQTILPKALSYPKQSEYEQHLVPFRHSLVREEQLTLYFPTLLQLLKHLKATGTNAFTHSLEGIWSPGRLRSAELNMREALQLSEGDPLPLTYNALQLLAQK